MKNIVPRLGHIFETIRKIIVFISIFFGAYLIYKEDYCFAALFFCLALFIQLETIIEKLDNLKSRKCLEGKWVKPYESIPAGATFHKVESDGTTIEFAAFRGIVYIIDIIRSGVG